MQKSALFDITKEKNIFTQEMILAVEYIEDRIKEYKPYYSAYIEIEEEYIEVLNCFRNKINKRKKESLISKKGVFVLFIDSYDSLKTKFLKELEIIKNKLILLEEQGKIKKLNFLYNEFLNGNENIEVLELIALMNEFGLTIGIINGEEKTNKYYNRLFNYLLKTFRYGDNAIINFKTKQLLFDDIGIRREFEKKIKELYDNFVNTKYYKEIKEANDSYFNSRHINVSIMSKLSKLIETIEKDNLELNLVVSKIREINEDDLDSFPVLTSMVAKLSEDDLKLVLQNEELNTKYYNLILQFCFERELHFHSSINNYTVIRYAENCEENTSQNLIEIPVLVVSNLVKILREMYVNVFASFPEKSKEVAGVNSFLDSFNSLNSAESIACELYIKRIEKLRSELNGINEYREIVKTGLDSIMDDRNNEIVFDIAKYMDGSCYSDKEMENSVFESTEIREKYYELLYRFLLDNKCFSHWESILYQISNYDFLVVYNKLMEQAKEILSCKTLLQRLSNFEIDILNQNITKGPNILSCTKQSTFTYKNVYSIFDIAPLFDIINLYNKEYKNKQNLKNL